MVKWRCDGGKNHTILMAGEFSASVSEQSIVLLQRAGSMLRQIGTQEEGLFLWRTQ